MKDNIAKAIGTIAIWGGGTTIVWLSPNHVPETLLALAFATTVVWVKDFFQ